MVTKDQGAILMDFLPKVDVTREHEFFDGLPHLKPRKTQEQVKSFS